MAYILPPQAVIVPQAELVALHAKARKRGQFVGVLATKKDGSHRWFWSLHAPQAAYDAIAANAAAGKGRNVTLSLEQWRVWDGRASEPGWRIYDERKICVLKHGGKVYVAQGFGVSV